MTISNHAWAIVLAGGEGSRLHGLTTDTSGVTVPKQFCSLTGGQSLLVDTLQRAASVFSMQILQGDETKLRLMKANRCGWSDLGTPKRLGETLRKLPHVGATSRDSINSAFALLNLSVQHARLGSTIRSASASGSANA